MANINRGFRSSASMEDILKFSKELYEPLSNRHLNELTLDNSKSDKSEIKDKSENKGDNSQNISGGREGSGNLFKNIYSKNTGEIVNQLFHDHNVMKNKVKNAKSFK